MLKNRPRTIKSINLNGDPLYFKFQFLKLDSMGYIIKSYTLCCVCVVYNINNT